MNASDLVASLSARGAKLTVAEDRLVVNAPRGVVTAEDRDALARCKAEVLALLDRPDVPPPPAIDWPTLFALRWGPGLTDPTPPIVIVRPNRERMMAAFRAAALNPDDYDLAEREAIQSEGSTHNP